MGSIPPHFATAHESQLLQQCDNNEESTLLVCKGWRERVAGRALVLQAADPGLIPKIPFELISKHRTSSKCLAAR